MGRLGVGLATTVALGLWVAAGVGVGGVDLEVHGFMEDEARCGECHHLEADGADWILDPYMFVRSVNEICKDCHAEEDIGRSHPVDVNPVEKLPLEELPQSLPLQWSDDFRTEVMTCGTCHNPHQPRFLNGRLYTLQRPFPGSDGRYLSYFLRVRGATPRDGFTPLCHACHPKL